MPMNAHPLLLPSESLYHIIHIKLLCTCQVTTGNTTNEHVHHLKPYSGRLETSIKLIVLCIKHMLWLPATEA